MRSSGFAQYFEPATGKRFNKIPLQSVQFRGNGRRSDTVDETDRTIGMTNDDDVMIS